MNEYLTIGILSVIIVSIISWMFATARHHYILRCVAATIVLILAVVNWILIADVIAWPINDYPPDKTYLISVIPQRTKHINYLWIVDPNNLIRGPRTYVVPYIEQEARQQKEALERAAKEEAIVIYRRPKNLRGKSGDGEGDEDATDGNGKAKGKGKGRPGDQNGNGDTRFKDDSGNGGTVEIETKLPEKQDLKETTRP